jgi:predicted flap endonuclease-1-like 5' DNA nuclease
MIYLIGQLALWLFLTAAFAAIAGWAYAAQRAAPVDAKLRRDREALVRDLSRLAAGEATSGDDIGASVELDALRRQLEVRNSRIVELEGLLGDARGRADEHAAQLAQMQRGLTDQREDGAEMQRLRALVATHEEERSREVEVIAEPVEPLIDEETLALQSWRLRYFEQRVKYLETRAAEAPTAPAIQPMADLTVAEEPPVAEWRARDAEARAEYLEQQVRALTAPIAAPESVEESASEEAEPFAANADVDILLRWRLLYLERRVAYLQADAARAAERAAMPVPLPEPEPEPLPVLEAGPDPDRWKWRARYLEARLRHLDARPLQVVVQTVAAPIAAEAEQETAAPSPSTVARKPPVLTAARNGAPDDFTLIDSMSALQQSTFNAIGIFHFDQIAAWTPEHVAWVDRYFRLRGRIVQEEWVEQAAELARHGVAAARRLEHEDA